MSELRARQRSVAREAILFACAELVTERRHLDFSMQEVAERAGVSLRTVYNHFAARDDMLSALGRHFDDDMTRRGGISVDRIDHGDPLREFRRAVRVNIPLFEELGGISEGFAQMPLANVGRDTDRARRTDGIVALVGAALGDEVPPATARGIGVLLRHLTSHRSWFWLTREYGLTTEEVVELLDWAITGLVQRARDGQLPEEV